MANERERPDGLGVCDAIVLETQDGQPIEFTVVGLVGDELDTRFAVCYSEITGEYVVTDLDAQPLDDHARAQRLFDAFLQQQDRSGPRPGPTR